MGELHSPSHLFKSMIRYCPNCGVALKGTERYCSRCGYGINRDYKTSAVSYNSIWIVTIAALAIILGMIIYNRQDFGIHHSVSSIVSHKKTISEIQSIKNVGEMRNAIDNTIWTHTKRGDLIWTKIEFKGDRVKIYYAMPSDGKWTFEEECSYTLEEGRFIDDGRRYIAAVIKTKDLSVSPKFIITSGHLSWLGFIDAGGFVLGDYEWD